jgi:carboxyl-terminal processing protease
MSEVKQSLQAAAGVVVCAVAVLVGASMRNQRDLGGAVAGPSYATQGLLASRAGTQEVPASDYFFALSEKLMKEYVEPVADEQKLASGAVRGMVNSLGDPKSTFMGKDEFKAFLNARQGQYEGIGVDLALVLDSTGPTVKRNAADTESNEASAEEALALGFRIPRVKVVNVVPGGPADRAGVKAGDFVYAVDDHWVANTAEVAEFRKTQKLFLEKKIERTEYNAIYKALRKKMDRALMPSKVTERLIVGGAGVIKVEWERGKQRRTTEIQKARVTAPALAVTGDVIRLPLRDGSVAGLKKALEGKSAVTLDLRHNANGDFTVMRECLALLAPAGKYGTLTTDKKEKPDLLIIEKGTASPPQITLLVDNTTGGAAEIFALALSNKGLAKLSGTTMAGDRAVRQIVQLPDGTGYTLVTGIYKPQIETSTVVAQRGAN